MEHLALHDDLTGLPNRVLFSDRVAAALAHAQRTGQNVALLFLDLDRFKTINDSLGHAAGNELLRLVGRRLRQCVREEDTVARLSGDEFALLLPEVAGADDRRRGRREDPGRVRRPVHRRQAGALREPAASASPLSPSDGDQRSTSLLKNADTAMYRAKERGRNNYQLYTAGHERRAHERLAARDQPAHAPSSRDELVLHYQPKVDLRTGGSSASRRSCAGTTRSAGLLSPAAFIPLAEETGLIVPLGEWALRRPACEQPQAWQRGRSRTADRVSQPSARQFEHSAGRRPGGAVLRDTGLDPALARARAHREPGHAGRGRDPHDARRSQAMGVRCSIDDFGTGYSGLSYLTRLPDRPAQDRQVLRPRDRPRRRRRTHRGGRDRPGHNLRPRRHRRGRGDDRQLDFLREHGCDEMQGFLFSRPVPAAQFEELLQLERVSPDQRPSSRQRLAALRAVS